MVGSHMPAKLATIKKIRNREQRMKNIRHTLSQALSDSYSLFPQSLIMLITYVTRPTKELKKVKTYDVFININSKFG